MTTAVDGLRFRTAAFFFALLGLVLDQLSKLHSESLLLHAVSPDGVVRRHLASSLLFALGVPPLQVRLGGASPESVSSSWFLVELTHVSNRGITFGLLEDAHPWVPVLAFYATTLLGVAIGAFALWKLRPATWASRAGAVLLITGVLGNLLDRLRIGYVIDWLVFAWRLSSWEVELPAFNFGDSYISAGVALLLLHVIARRRRTSASASPTT